MLMGGRHIGATGVITKLEGNSITTTDSNANLELRANGTGRIFMPSNDVEIQQNLDIRGTITVGNVTSTDTVAANRFTTEGKTLFFKDVSSLIQILEDLGTNQLFEIKNQMLEISKRRYTWKRISKIYKNASF